MTLSRKAKEAIKVALAMSLAYGIALQLGWDKPMWAGFAVAFVSLATVGQSMNKAALRMLGTLIAVVIALLLIALFAQDRWLFMLFLSAWVGFCSYMMGGKKHQYFWNVCGFVCVIICMDAGPDAVNAFDLAMLRAEETGLGILVYSLVAVLLWPSKSRAGFEAAVVTLASTLHQQYQAYLCMMNGKGSVKDTQALRAQEIHARTGFSQLLDAAVSDSYDVWEQRQQWRCYQRQAHELGSAMEHWRESLPEVLVLDLQPLLPGLADFSAELEKRFVQIERMLAGQAPERAPLTIGLAVNTGGVQTLSHFQRAALAVSRTRLLQIERLTRSLFGSIAGLKGFGQASAVCDTIPSPQAGIVPDPDRVVAVMQVMATLWLAWFAVIFVSDIPGGAGFVTMAGSLGMAMASMPQLSVTLLLVPAATSVLFASLVYIFVMPQLSSFLGLGVLIFTVTFAICYLFAAPRQMLGRAFGLAMFVSIASISNEQSYSFYAFATTVLMFPLIFLLLAITANIPFSSRPERAFLRLLGRFFRSCEYLISSNYRDPHRPETRLERWRTAFHASEVSNLPAKLGAWARVINTRVLPGTTPQQVQVLLTSLESLSSRMQTLIESRAYPQSPLLVQALSKDTQAWPLMVARTFQHLSRDPTAVEQAAFRSKLDSMLGHMEETIKNTLNKLPEGQLSEQDAENFYGLLGAYRDVSEALVNFAAGAEAIDWSRWREARFA